MSLINDLIRYLSIFSILPPLLYSLHLLWRTKGRLILQIFWFSVFIATVEAAGVITASRQLNNFWISHIYVPIEFVLLATMYFYAFDSGNVRRFILAAIVLFCLFCAFNVLYLESLVTYNSYPRAIESVLLVSFAVFYFYQKLKRLDQRDLFDDPYVLLSVGVLFNFAVASVYNSLFNLMLEQSREYLILIMNVFNFSNIVFNIMLVFVLTRAPKK